MALPDPSAPIFACIGAAGPEARGAPAAGGGMAKVLYQTLRDLTQQVQRDGRTITAEAVDYPAVPVPDEDGGVMAWAGFMSSVDAGAAALGAQYASVSQLCPTTKAVLPGDCRGPQPLSRNL